MYETTHMTGSYQNCYLVEGRQVDDSITELQNLGIVCDALYRFFGIAETLNMAVKDKFF